MASCNGSSTSKSHSGNATKGADAAIKGVASRPNEVVRIDKFVQPLRRVRDPHRRVEVITETDSESYLIVYGTSSAPARARLRIGLSTEVAEYDFFFKDKDLIYLCITSFNYPLGEGGIVYDERQLAVAGRDVLYFSGDRLISHTSNGKMDSEYVDASKGSDEKRLANYLVKHWDDKIINLEAWIKEGVLAD